MEIVSPGKMEEKQVVEQPVSKGGKNRKKKVENAINMEELRAKITEQANLVRDLKAASGTCVF